MSVMPQGIPTLLPKGPGWSHRSQIMVRNYSSGLALPKDVTGGPQRRRSRYADVAATSDLWRRRTAITAFRIRLGGSLSGAATDALLVANPR